LLQEIDGGATLDPRLVDIIVCSKVQSTFVNLSKTGDPTLLLPIILTNSDGFDRRWKLDFNFPVCDITRTKISQLWNRNVMLPKNLKKYGEQTAGVA
jgi:hypothetical protein